MSEPSRVVAGDTWSWMRQDQAFLPSAGYSLTYVFTCMGHDPVAVTATQQDASTFVATVPPATTAAISAGTWKWTAFATKGTDRWTAGTGVLIVDPDPAQATAATETRTHNEICLAAIRAVLQRKMADPLVEYEIEGFKAKHLSHEKLIDLEVIYCARVRRERGGSPVRLIPVRFGRV